MGCQAASPQLLLTKGKPERAAWSWLCNAWLFYNCFLFLSIWKTGLSFLWGVRILGQSQNCRQPQHRAPACEQGLFCSMLCFFPNVFKDHYLFDDPIAVTYKEFFPCYCPTNLQFLLPGSFPKVSLLPKLFIFLLTWFSNFTLHHWSSYCSLDSSSKTFPPNFPDFWSWLIYLQIFFHSIYFCFIFFHAESELILPCHLVISRCIRNPTFPGKNKNPKAIFFKNHALLREYNDLSKKWWSE